MTKGHPKTIERTNTFAARYKQCKNVNVITYVILLTLKDDNTTGSF